MNELVVEVKIWGKTVGAVSAAKRRGMTAPFQYDKDFVKSGLSLSPILIPLNTRVHAFGGLNDETYSGLPGLLADALPDKFGNKLIDAYMMKKGIPRTSITVLQRLLYMGRRGLGALEFEPATESTSEASEPLAMSALVEDARRAIRGQMTNIGPEIIQVGTSAGGARAKAVVGYNKDTSEIVSGQFDVPDGFEHWLLKFDGVGEDNELGSSQGYGRIEYAYSLMAAAAGIDMPETRLLEEGGRAHFMTKRFDRIGNDKLHVQTLCALQHADFNEPRIYGYDLYFRTAQELGLGKDSLEEAYRRMVFNVAARNCDDHTKNLAFVMGADGDWSLSKAYDVTFAWNPKGVWTNSHQMMVNGKAQGITRSDLMDVSREFGITRGKAIIGNVLDAVQKWPTFAERANICQSEVSRIGSTHLTLRSL